MLHSIQHTHRPPDGSLCSTPHNIPTDLQMARCAPLHTTYLQTSRWFVVPMHCPVLCEVEFTTLLPNELRIMDNRMGKQSLIIFSRALVWVCVCMCPNTLLFGFCRMFPDVTFLKTADNVLSVSDSSLAIAVEVTAYKCAYTYRDRGREQYTPLAVAAQCYLHAPPPPLPLPLPSHSATCWSINVLHFWSILEL